MSTIIQHHQAIKDDLLRQIAELQTQVAFIDRQIRLAELQALADKEVNGFNSPQRQVNGLNNPQSQVSGLLNTQPQTVIQTQSTYSPREPRGGTITLVVGAEKVLRDAGKPLHASKIVEEMAKLGKETNVRSLNSTMLQDTQKRFVNHGQNVFGLSEWGGVLSRAESLAAAATTGQPQALPIGAMLERALRDAGRPMKVSEIIEAARRMGVTASDASIRSTLSSDHRERFVRLEQGIYGLKSQNSDKLDEQSDFQGSDTPEQVAA